MKNILLLWLMTAACYSQNAKEIKKEKTPAEIQTEKRKYSYGIKNQQVGIGMPAHVVISSWGEPTRKFTSKKGSDTTFIWYYEKRSSAVTFIDGKVSEVSAYNSKP